MFTTAMLLQLRDAGKVSLDDQVSSIEPRYSPKPHPCEFWPRCVRSVLGLKALDVQGTAQRVGQRWLTLQATQLDFRGIMSATSRAPQH